MLSLLTVCKRAAAAFLLLLSVGLLASTFAQSGNIYTQEAGCPTWKQCCEVDQTCPSLYKKVQQSVLWWSTTNVFKDFRYPEGTGYCYAGLQCWPDFYSPFYTNVLEDDRYAYRIWFQQVGNKTIAF